MQSTRILSVSGPQGQEPIVQGWLSESGNLFESASSTEEAANRLAQSEFDLILLPSDPGKIAEIARLQRSGRPVIASLSDGADPAAGYAAGVSVYLSSPPTLAELQQTVRGISLFSAPVFDWDTALENMGMMEIVQEIIKVFLSEAPALLEQVRQAMAQGELAGIARAAHRFAAELWSLEKSPACKRPADSNVPRRAVALSPITGSFWSSPMLGFTPPWRRLFKVTFYRPSSYG